MSMFKKAAEIVGLATATAVAYACQEAVKDKDNPDNTKSEKAVKRLAAATTALVIVGGILEAVIESVFKED